MSTENKRELYHHESVMGSGDSGFSFDDDDLSSIFSQRPGVDRLHDLHGLDAYMSFANDYGFLCSPPSDAYDSHRGIQMSKFVSGNNTSGATCGGGGSGVMPVTPNSSISSSSTEMIVDDSGRCKDNQRKLEEEKHEQEAKEVEDVGDDNPKKEIKPIRKKGEKRKREPSFAFMTKSEVDHLEDGYRWRKYGQKAVKNSPYPRSYYRCTTQKCSVKKRVERSYQDPTVVITTYEGQHTHQSPATIRGGSHLLAPPSPMLSSFRHEMISHEMNHNVQMQGGTNLSNNMYLQNLPTPLHQLQISDYGLLQDMIVPSFINDGQHP